MPTRSYTYYDFTLSLCASCLRRVDAKIIIEEGGVFMLKRCPQHGPERVLLSTDAEYYRLCRDVRKPGETPLQFNTNTHYGCPYDCGLCPDHEQHSCLTVLEVTDRCNLSCPLCYSASSPRAGRHRSLAEIDAMLDGIEANEGRADVVQVSGGEPTMHPHFFEILRRARRRSIRHLMLNTNGLRIARRRDFARQLAEFQPGFEVYLQFDSLESDALRRLRGLDLADLRRAAIDRLNEADLSTTLVVALQRGVNLHQIGEILEFARQQPCVRGVTFQPVQFAGRVPADFDGAAQRLTLAEVRQEILKQSSIFSPADLIPTPCNPDSLAMAYALKMDQHLLPLSRFADPRSLFAQAGATIVFEQNEALRENALKEMRELAGRVFSLGASAEGAAGDLNQLLCCLPAIRAPGLSYKNIFRVIIMQFLDAHSFDVRAVKRSCVHMIQPDGRMIPFDTFNLLYRDALAAQRLAPLRELASQA